MLFVRVFIIFICCTPYIHFIHCFYSLCSLYSSFLWHLLRSLAIAYHTLLVKHLHTTVWPQWADEYVWFFAHLSDRSPLIRNKFERKLNRVPSETGVLVNVWKFYTFVVAGSKVKSYNFTEVSKTVLCVQKADNRWIDTHKRIIIKPPIHR